MNFLIKEIFLNTFKLQTVVHQTFYSSHVKGWDDIFFVFVHYIKAHFIIIIPGTISLVESWPATFALVTIRVFSQLGVGMSTPLATPNLEDQVL